ncbi:MAG: DUF305 domain-containing protein [Pyrinomonadaceae bacterium]
MKKNFVFGLLLTAVLALFLTACQTQPSNNTTANNSTNAAVHDMSNMSNMNHDMSNMQDRDMTNMDSDPGASQRPFDLQFLDSMIHHHNGAVTMAKMVLGKTERPELKGFAQKIIDDQTKEIAEIKRLREQWFSGMPPAVNMEMPGMVGGMEMMNGEHMKDMADMEPKHFDRHFLRMMLAHHEGAVIMSNDALKQAEHPEVKQLAQRIITAQQPEIEQMKKWLAAWGE